MTLPSEVSLRPGFLSCRINPIGGLFPANLSPLNNDTTETDEQVYSVDKNQQYEISYEEKTEYKELSMKTWIILILVAGLAITGCATKTGTGAAVGTGVGAAVGAGAGQAIGRSTEATLLGAGIGAIIGGLSGEAIGNYMDKQEQSMRQAISNSEAATVRREQEIVQGAHKENVQVLTVSFKSDYLFATNSAAIMPGAQPEIQRVADVLRQYPETTIQVAGHTDAQGSEVYNQQLSERRAQRQTSSSKQD